MPNNNSALQVFSRLKKAVQSETDAGLAKALGISQASVASSKKKGQIPPGWIIYISREFNVSADWLIYGITRDFNVQIPSADNLFFDGINGSEEIRVHKDKETLIESMSPDAFLAIAKFDSYNPMLGPTLLYADADKPIVSIPILDSTYASSIVDGDEFYEFDTAFFRASWIARFGAPDKLLIFKQKDDSMQPLIHKEDAVLINRAHRSSTSGSMVAIAIDDDISIRKIERKPGRIVFRALNKSYLDIEVDAKSEGEHAVIVGKVLWWCHKEA